MLIQPKKRIIAFLLLYSHILTSCFNPYLGTKKQEFQAITETLDHKKSQTSTNPSLPANSSQQIVKQTANAAFAWQQSQKELDTADSQLLIDQAHRRQQVQDNKQCNYATNEHPFRQTTKRNQATPQQNLDFPKHHIKVHSSKEPQALQAITGKLVGKKITLKAGQEIEFCQAANVLQAKVYEQLGNFTRDTLSLPVYVEDKKLIEIGNVQARNIQLITPEQDKGKQQGYVYIGKQGLLGGGKNNKRKGAHKHKLQHTTKPREDFNNNTTKIKDPIIKQHKQKLVEDKFIKLLEELGTQIKVKGGISPTCFLSYAWHDKQADSSFHELDQSVHQLAKYLWLAGIEVLLDLEKNHAGTSIDQFVQLIDKVDYVMWMGSKKLVEKCSDANLVRARQLEFQGKSLTKDESLPVVSQEAVRIQERLTRENIVTKKENIDSTSLGKGFLIPVCLEEKHKAAFPEFIHRIVSQPMMDGLDYSGIFKLLSIMYPGWESLIEIQEKALEEYQIQVKQMEDQELVAIDQDLAYIQAAKQENFKQALKANIQAEVKKIEDRSAELTRLGANWHLKPRETYLLQQARLALDSRYRNHSIQLLDDSAPIPLNELYLNLVIVQEEEQEKKEKSGLNTDNRQALLGTYEMIHQAKEPIALQDLFKPQKTRRSQGKEVVPQRLLLTGRAGIGKSTLCKYIPYQWQQQAYFTDIPWVFHIELKRLISLLSDKEKQLSLEELLRTYFWKSAGLTASESELIWKILREHPNDILWILDGYDEVAHLNHPVVNQLLDQPRYILTSRPHAIAPKERAAVDLILENIGFTDRNIAQYITKRFAQHAQEDIQAKTLLDWLQNNPSLKSLCALPIYLELLCQVWIEEKETLISQGELGFADLYQLIINQLMKRFLQRLDPIHKKPALSPKELQEKPEVQLAQRFLGSLAFKGMQTGRLLISGSQFEECYDQLEATLTGKTDLKQSLKLLTNQWNLEQLIQGVGLLKEVGDQANFIKKDYYFIHLTFQEYYAAWYIMQGLYQAPETPYYKEVYQFIMEHKYDPSYEVVWSLLAGLLKRKPDLMARYLKLLEEPTSQDLLPYNHLGLLASTSSEGIDEQTKELAGMQAMIPRLQAGIKGLYQCYKRYTYPAREAFRFRNLLDARPRLMQLEGKEDLAVQLPYCNPEEGKNLVNFVDYLRLSSPLSLQALAQYLKDEDWQVRSSAAAALVELGEKSATKKEVVQALTRYFKDENYYVRRSAAEALDKIGEKAATPAVLEALTTCLKHEDHWVRESAAEALGYIGEKAATKEVLQALTSRLKHEDNGVRRSAAYDLGDMATYLPNIAQNWLQEKNINSAMDRLVPITIAAFLAGNISIQVLWNEQDQAYYWQGYVNQKHFQFVVTPQQAQLLKVMVPKILDQFLLEGEVDKSSLNQALQELSTPEQDSIHLPEYEKSLNQKTATVQPNNNNDNSSNKDIWQVWLQEERLAVKQKGKSIFISLRDGKSSERKTLLEIVKSLSEINAQLSCSLDNIQTMVHVICPSLEISQTLTQDLRDQYGLVILPPSTCLVM